MYTAYIRIKNRWRRIGQYGTKCRQFIPDTISNETSTPTAKLENDTPSTEQIPKKVINYTPYGISDDELSQLCKILGKV